MSQLTPPPIDCATAREDAAAFVLGALDAGEAAAVRRHLATCAEPHPEFAELGAAVPHLAAAVDEVEPPAALRARILAAAADERAAHAVEARFAPRRTWRARLATPVPAWALAVAAAVVVAVGAYSLSLQGEVRDARAQADQLRTLVAAAAAPGQSPVRLAGSAAAPAASGLAVRSSAGTAYLAVVGLPAAPAGRTYEAWIIDGGTPRPAGTFQVGSGGIAILSNMPAYGPSASIAVTLEPSGGSDHPTSPVLVVGTAAS